MTRRRALGFGMWMLAMAAAAQAQVPATPAALAVTETTATPYAWRGQESEVEEYLKSARIERFTDVPVGVTKPRRGYFADGGLVHSMCWKPIVTSRGSRPENYRSEIAAYRLSRLLGLDVVPPAVQRSIGGDYGAVIYWIDNVRPWDPAAPPARAGAKWSAQTARMMMFDLLIANIDRNRGNLLVDDDGNLYLIDHSRAFGTGKGFGTVRPPQQFDRQLWQRMASLTRADFDAAVGQWLDKTQIDAMLARRDAMRVHIDRQVQAQGETATFLPASQQLRASR